MATQSRHHGLDQSVADSAPSKTASSVRHQPGFSAAYQGLYTSQSGVSHEVSFHKAAPCRLAVLLGNEIIWRKLQVVGRSESKHREQSGELLDIDPWMDLTASHHFFRGVCTIDKNVQAASGDDFVTILIRPRTSNLRETYDQPKYRKYDSMRVSASSRSGKHPSRY